MEGDQNTVGSAIRFNLFESFATSELTHSGIWAWILQSLDENAPEVMHELRAPARALMNRLDAPQVGPRVRVDREKKLPNPAGRVDIEVSSDGTPVLVIETKVKARPDLEQLQRYGEAYEAMGHRPTVAILSTTIDDLFNDREASFIGPKSLLDVLRAGEYDSDLMRQYVEWMDHNVRARQAGIDAALGAAPAACAAALVSSAVQWAVMCRIGDAIGGPPAAGLFSGRNLGGSAWTQLCFSPYSPPDFDMLFYRLEAWEGGGAQFTLRQYRKVADIGKQARLEKLRQLFEAAAGPSMRIFDTSPKRAKKGAGEAQVAQVKIPHGTMGAVLDALPQVHERFVASLHQAGWPMGPC